jgi:peptide methionine sulfoxide reductase MsrA
VGGIIRTRLGYSGGEMLYPTYRNMGDHSETIQIDYDPDRISYRALLNICPEREIINFADLRLKTAAWPNQFQ